MIICRDGFVKDILYAGSYQTICWNDIYYIVR